MRITELFEAVPNERLHLSFQDAQSTDAETEPEGNKTQNGDVGDVGDVGDASHQHPVPETLEYLDSMCPHKRLTCLVQALRSASDHSNEVTSLTDLAVKYHLDRLQRIVDEALAS